MSDEAVHNEVVQGDAEPEDSDGARIRQLAKLRGIGADIATVLGREVFWRRFANRRAVARYFGLTPAPYDSGDSRTDQGIDKAGNPRARAMAVQMAWMWLRHQPNSELARWFHRRSGDMQGAHPSHHDHRPCAEAGDRIVAICRSRLRPARCSREGVKLSQGRELDVFRDGCVTLVVGMVARRPR